MNFRSLLSLLCLWLLAGPLFGQGAHTPAGGSEERKSIMDALRGPAERDLKQPVIFKVDRLRVAGEWAFARVAPLTPSGGGIDFTKTKFRKLIELGAFDPLGEALLRREGDAWKVLEWVFGATDEASVTWADKYPLPKALLE